MKVKECYEHAVSFLPEKPEENPEMQKFMVAWCNVLLAETFEYENIYRVANKLPEIWELPKVESENDEIPYNERLVRGAFPYGMARWIFRENEDIAASHEYYALYANAIREATPILMGEVEEKY
ncbi:MAG: hypothetical protein IJ306_07165 [Oscillospiraceae bacterium]|nr:hypothetical protein [Oscillospiraceae bacterium]